MKTTVTLLLLSFYTFLHGQGTTYSWFYRVYLKDKGENTNGVFTPGELLSERALNRRQKAQIPVPDFLDIPVFTDYLNQISASGLKLHCTSKWMNTALFKSELPIDINTLFNMPFVADVKIVKTKNQKGKTDDKLSLHVEQTSLPPFNQPLIMVNGYSLHNSGYNGKNILIAVLDGGFLYADVVSSLSSLRNRNGIKATWDFVNNKLYPYDANIHGTAVLSVLAGAIPGQLEGTAPGADYLLLKTEDTGSEFPCEEDYWAAGAEFADSAGADIISSSLGYSVFDNPALSYKYSDLDGNRAFVTRVADIAASKGILVVNSAGNERNKPWIHIICPADGDSVLAVGAVDGNNEIAVFSSTGLSADGRIKPDNTVMGVNVTVQTSATSIGRSNGTSFSCPVLSGMAACLMQAVPQALNTDIIKVLHSSAHMYNTPDSLYGYGIPDMGNALIYLQNLFIKVPDEETLAYPSPTYGDIEIIFRQAPGPVSIEIVSMTGLLIARKELPFFSGRTIRITELQNREQGIYFIRLIRNSGIIVHKVIKLSN